MPVASAILPAWARKSPKIAEVLPLLYLHGLSRSDLTPALEQFLGSGAGLSASERDHPSDDAAAGRAAGVQRPLARPDNRNASTIPECCRKNGS